MFFVQNPTGDGKTESVDLWVADGKTEVMPETERLQQGLGIQIKVKAVDAPPSSVFIFFNNLASLVVCTFRFVDIRMSTLRR